MDALFPFQSTGFHYDSLLFENTTFANISRIVMMEGNEYGDNIHLNHCTILNTLEWVIQSDWIHNLSITNSLIVNPYFLGYRAIDVCDSSQDYNDFLTGKCNSPGGALFNVVPVDSFGFEPGFTDMNRHIFIGNNSYVYQDWVLNWYRECGWCQNAEKEFLYNPFPYAGKKTISFMDSMDTEGNKVFKTMNIDSTTMYSLDPNFITPATNQDTILFYIENQYGWNYFVDWSYRPDAGKNRIWPLPENLSYTNDTLLTAAMDTFPLGDFKLVSSKINCLGSAKRR